MDRLRQGLKSHPPSGRGEQPPQVARSGRVSVRPIESSATSWSCCRGRFESADAKPFPLAVVASDGLLTTLPEGGWRLRVCALLALLLFVLVGCDSPQSSKPPVPVSMHHRIAVTNYPLYCIVQTICGESNDVVKNVIYVGPPHGVDPHSWMPSIEQIRELQSVDLIVCNGAGAAFATWVDKVTLPEDRLCKTTDAIKLEEFVIVKDYQLVHSHGPEGEHSHSWVVPQSWLSPTIARKQAKLCMDRMVEFYGQSKSFDDGFAEVKNKLDGLEAACEFIKNSDRDFTVACSTPDILYLTRAIGLGDRYLQWTESRPESDAEKELDAMRARAVKENPDAPQSESLFLWSGKVVESLSGFANQQWKSVVEVDLIAAPNEDGDLDPEGYFERMASNLERIRVATQ